tara:strand:+ start:247 stop:435 length:189 start_codon:yes stop_codon:yes gene_type:complete
MPEKVRPIEQAEKYWVQPSEGVELVRRDMSETQVEEALARIAAGESIDSVVDYYYDLLKNDI